MKYFNYDNWKTTPPDYYTPTCPICGEDFDRDGECPNAEAWYQAKGDIEDAAYDRHDTLIDMTDATEEETTVKAKLFDINLPDEPFCYYRRAYD